MSTGRAAEAIRAQAQHAVKALGRSADYGIVRAIAPLQVEMSSHRLMLEADDLVVTQWVRRYDLEQGIKAGDTVLLQPMPNGDFLVTDVIAAKDTFRGVSDRTADLLDSSNVTLTAPSGGGTVTQSHSIIKKVPYRNDAGVIVGYIPIYGTLP